jgi:hypothetical protein
MSKRNRQLGAHEANQANINLVLDPVNLPSSSSAALLYPQVCEKQKEEHREVINRNITPNVTYVCRAP